MTLNPALLSPTTAVASGDGGSVREFRRPVAWTLEEKDLGLGGGLSRPGSSRAALLRHRLHFPEPLLSITCSLFFLYLVTCVYSVLLPQLSEPCAHQDLWSWLPLTVSEAITVNWLRPRLV